MKQTTHRPLVLIAAVAALSGCASQQSTSGSGWQTLIDGVKGMENFNRVGNANWVAADGAIQATFAGTGTDSGFLVTKESYRDFTIKAELWVAEGTNSGIFIRCDDPVKVGAATCYEINIFDKRPDPTYGTGAIVNVAKVEPIYKADGKWNTLEITAKGSRLTVVLNGQKTADAEDGKHAAGPFALQFGVGTSKFRSVQVKPL